MLDGLIFAVQVVAFLTGTGLAVSLEQICDLVEAVGLGAEVTHTTGHFLAHLNTGVTMKAVTLNYGGFDAVTEKDVLEGALDGGGAGA